jgi:mannose-6-phosphate isomerase-like protein (cupin superfamily)
MHHLTPTQALQNLAEDKKLFHEFFRRGDFSVEIYKPANQDLQQPHDQDEVYFVVSGSGKFFNDGHIHDFGAGDFLFVEARKEHRFFDYSDDFATWVVFFGERK